MTALLNKTTSPVPSTPMFLQYQEIKEQYPECLLFYRMGDFYELFFEDAIKAAKALDIALTKRGKNEGCEVPMCGVPFHAADSYLAKLIRQGYHVAICEQMESPEEAKKRKGKTLVRRDVVRVVTPGTLTEENLLEATSYNYLVTIVSKGALCGVAAVDISTGDFFVESTELPKLPTLLERLRPKEIVLPDTLLNSPKTYEFFQDWKRVLTPQPTPRFDLQNGEKRLKEFYGVHSLQTFGDFSAQETAAAGAALEYINLTQKGLLPKLKNLKKNSPEAYVEIDVATRKSLELFATLSGEYKGSLLEAINHTRSALGARRLGLWLSSPLAHAGAINNRLDMVSFFLKEPKARHALQEILENLADLERLIARLSLGRGGPRDLGLLKNTLQEILSIKPLFEKTADLPGGVAKCVTNLNDYTLLLERLTKSLMEENLALHARDGGFIKQGLSNELDTLIELRDNGRSHIKELQERLSRELDIPSLKVKHNNVLGYYIEVTSVHKNKVPETFIHRQTLVNNYRYTTLELSKLQESIAEASEKALLLELEFFQNLVTEVLKYASPLATTAEAISVLDVTSSFAELSEARNYTKPTIDESSSFKITSGRHPVIERVLEGENEPFTPNTCSLEENENIWLITGPNMAGKSTFLRQNALITILAKIGCYVPAKSAHIGIVDKIFSRVGASDNLAKGQSTFMVEMIETSAILNQATEKSLVILDEIGRGTATFDGLSIAWATLEHLHNTTNCRTLFATHYHELVALEKNLKNLRPYTMDIKEHEGKIIFLHKIKKGSADRSYGIHVAGLAGLPPSVIKRAEEVLETLESGKTHKRVERIAAELPLFQMPSPQKDSALEKKVKEIDPNDLSPREALDALYEIKKLVS